MNIQVYLDNFEITDYLISLDDLEYNVGEYGQLFSIDTFKITLNNSKKQFDPYSNNSPFYNNDINNHTIDIYRDGLILIQGFVYSCIANYETSLSELTMAPSNAFNLDQSCIYSSDTDYTPSQIVADICELYKISYDPISIGGSNSIYELDEIYINVYALGDSSIRDIIRQIAEIGCARVYIYKNRLYYNVYQAVNPAIEPVYIFNDNSSIGIVNIYSTPQIDNLNKQKIDGYSVEYVGGTGIFNEEAKLNKSISGGESNAVRITTLQSAIWIGEKWMEYLASDQFRITFNCSKNIGKSLDLGQIIGFTLNNVYSIFSIVGVAHSETYTKLILESV